MTKQILLNQYDKYVDAANKADMLKHALIDDLNVYLISAYNKTLNAENDISIYEMTIDANTPHFLAGMQVLEIWESDNDNDYSCQYLLPVKLLVNGLNVKQEMLKLESAWKVEWAKKVKKAKEESDKREFIRLSKKFK